MPEGDDLDRAANGIERASAAVARSIGRLEQVRDELVRLERRMRHVVAGSMPLDDDVELALYRTASFADSLDLLDRATALLVGTAETITAQGPAPVLTDDDSAPVDAGDAVRAS